MHIYLPKPNRSLGIVDACGLIGFVGLLVARFTPFEILLPFWRCGFRMATGIPCPGCGLTRVAERFARFNVIGAFKVNPLGTMAAVFFAVMVGVSFLHLAFKMPIPELVLSEKEWQYVRWVALLLFVANYAWVIFSHTQLHVQ